MKAYKIILKGKVQGVGFRYFTEKKAKEYEIKGYVKNRHDITAVEIHCEGEEKSLNRFIENIIKGPALAEVTNKNIEEIQPENYNNFNITY